MNMMMPQPPATIYEMAPDMQPMDAAYTWYEGWKDGLFRREYAQNIDDQEARFVYEVGYEGGEKSRRVRDDLAARPGAHNDRSQEPRISRYNQLLAFMAKYEPVLDLAGPIADTLARFITAYALLRMRRR